VDASSNYMGCVILGSGFTIHHLDRSFQAADASTLANDISQGEKEVRTVTKIGIIQKSLDQAVVDLDSVKMNRIIHNPHGSQVMNRVSSDSIIRSFEKDQASKVIGILRVFAGVSAVNTAPSVSKRKRDDDEETANASKRARLAEF
jgi:hypothetical protein